MNFYYPKPDELFLLSSIGLVLTATTPCSTPPHLVVAIVSLSLYYPLLMHGVDESIFVLRLIRVLERPILQLPNIQILFIKILSLHLKITFFVLPLIFIFRMSPFLNYSITKFNLTTICARDMKYK